MLGLLATFALALVCIIPLAIFNPGLLLAFEPLPIILAFCLSIFQGSFGKAFGRRVKQEDDKDTDSTPIHQVASDKPKQKTKSRVRSRSEHRSRDKRHSSSTDRNSSIT